MTELEAISLVLEGREVVLVHRLLDLAAELRGRRLVEDGDGQEVMHVVLGCLRQPQEDRDAEVPVWDPRDAACLHLDDVCLLGLLLHHPGGVRRGQVLGSVRESDPRLQ